MTALRVLHRLGALLAYLGFALGLALLFLWLLLPRQALPDLMAGALNRAWPQLRWQVRSLSLRLPEGLRLAGVEGYGTGLDKAPQVRIDSLTVRPDLAVLVRSGRPQAHYRLVLARGEVTGTVGLEDWNRGLRLAGTMAGVELAELPLLARFLGRDIDGTLAATFKGVLATAGGGALEGELAVANGRLALRRPVLAHRSLPFSRATVQLRANGPSLQLDQGQVESELFSGQFAGAVTWPPDQPLGRIRIQGQLQPRPLFFKGVSSGAVLQLLRSQLKDNTLPFRISGSPDDPGLIFEEYAVLFQSLQKELN